MIEEDEDFVLMALPKSNKKVRMNSLEEIKEALSPVRKSKYRSVEELQKLVLD